ncbi:C2 family cysteine protease [Planctomicrobium sp. SH664]|uniref:C2 family cysteine protease n=1 Tax=Planctomicrobium sp. SH664 TaxID=3448125 RepID=UPI003F5CAFD5
MLNTLRKIGSRLLTKTVTPSRRRNSRVNFDASETLEVRMLPAATLTATLTKGVLEIEGTSKADTIKVRQSNGLAGTFISIDNCKISSGGKLLSSVSSSAITKIEIQGLAGNDIINLHVTSFEAVSIPATVWGGTGDDTISGGTGNDTLFGNAGSDVIFGNAGNDFLHGGTAGVGGATVAEKDRLVGGAGFDKYSDGFDFKNWIVGGISVTDINQENSPTCQTLATLSAAVTAGISFASPKISYLGNNNYSVKLYDNGNAVYETVNFDGTWSDNDPSPSMDSKGYLNAEYWTILMQRARLERFYKIDWSTNMTEADWDRANSKNGGTLYSVSTAMKQMHGGTTNTVPASLTTGQVLADALKKKTMIVAGTSGSTKKETNSVGLVTGHAYTVVSATKDKKGAWTVKVYNPWGTDGGSIKDTTNDGYVTLTLSQFQNGFSTVYYRT